MLRFRTLSVFPTLARIENWVRGPQKGLSKSKELATLSKLISNMDFCYFVGIDISKDTAPADRLDWAVYTQQQGILLSIQTDNTLKGIRSALVQLKALPGWNSVQAVFCQEHTARAAPRHLQCPSIGTFA